MSVLSVQNVVVVFTSMMAWLIPDIPTMLAERIRRETYITNEIILRTELQRAQGSDLDEHDRSRSDELTDEHSSKAENYSPHLSEDIEMDVRHRATSVEVDPDKTYI